MSETKKLVTVYGKTLEEYYKEVESIRAQLAAYKGCEEALEYYGFKIVPDSLNKGKTEITTKLGETAREALEALRKAKK